MSLGRPAITSILNTASSAAALFVTYRSGFMHAGGDFMGLWALVSGLLMFARISDTGASISVARLAAIGRTELAIGVGPFLWAGLTVATIPTITLSVAIAVAFSMLSNFGSSGTISGVILTQALVVSCMYAAGNSVAGVLSGCLDGVGKMVPRYLCGIIANILLVILAVTTLPSLGAQGFLIAHVSYITTLVAAYAILLVLTQASLRTSAHEYFSVTRSSISFLSKSIVMGAARAGFEPVSKMLISHFAGLTAVALFDLALRVSSQLRQLANAPLQPIAVLTARSTATLSSEHQPVVEKWMILGIAAGFSVALGQILSAPAVAWLVVGRVDGSFVIISAVLALSLFVNFSGTVAFYVVLASGRLKGLLILHAFMTVLNLVLGASMGWIWGGMGVVIAWGITLAIGGPITLGLYLADHPMPARRIRRIVLVFAGGIAILTAATAATISFLPFIDDLIEVMYNSGISKTDAAKYLGAERFYV